MDRIDKPAEPPPQKIPAQVSGSRGGKKSSANRDMAALGKQGANARWQRYREEREHETKTNDTN